MLPSYATSLLFLFTTMRATVSVERNFYVAIHEENWDYAPSGLNHINGRSVSADEHASVFLTRGAHQIGSVYKKAMYMGYSDDSFTKRISKPPWLGYLGPVLRAEVGDVIVVQLRNHASRPYSMHPHGVFYEKDAEGALYPDQTSGALKQDDAVAPGGNHTYRWLVKPEHAPMEGDSNCLTWAYHSHVDAPKDIYSGLIGTILVCRKGTLTQTAGQNPLDVRRADVDQDLILMFSVVDENLSWYLHDNINTFCSDPGGIHLEDEEFQESNLMHAINGYVYGNLPGIDLCVNRVVAWHLFGMGNEVDMHSVYFHGHTLLDRGHRTDVVSLFPASFVTADMVPSTPGTWLLNCQVNDHLHAGMQALFQVSMCGKHTEPGVPVETRIRRYFIAAEKLLWNYGPSELDMFQNVSLTEGGRESEVFFGRDGGRLGGKYDKVVYVEYTNESFSEKKIQTEAEKHLGILGPVLAAEEGDVLEVTFLNKADRNYSIQPHGLQYNKSSEGALYQDGTTKSGSHVAPRERFTYRWLVRDGPSPADPPCISYLYFSSSDPVKDTNAGLVGPLKVCRRGSLSSSSGSQLQQSGRHREFFLLFSVWDENQSWYLEDNIKTYGTSDSDPEAEYFQESNKMHGVNGFLYGNLPGLNLCQGDSVTWHVFGLGTEGDMHGVHFQGNTFQLSGMTRDTLSVFPHTSVTVSMEADTAGVFEVSCRVTDHYVGGMRQRYQVRHCNQRNSADVPSPATVSPTHLVQYFISAEEVVWDYAPNRTWELQKHNTTADESPGSVFLGRGENHIGSKYKKVVYKEYTDATFSTPKTRAQQEEHLGILGPIIRAEVGETIQVIFKNMASRPFNIYAHGIGTRQQAPVKPGDTGSFQWNVLIRSGPGKSDPDCISYAYYSTVDFVKDTASGLIGPLVVCRRGVLNANRRPRSVSREFALLFMVFDENQSWYLEDNISTYLGQKNPNADEADFQESNMMHGINGKLYANLHGISMVEGDKVQWYLLGMGNEVDIHTVHLHGQTFTYKMAQSHRADVYDLFPGSFQTVNMVAGSAGTWLLHCHVADHIHAGMETTFTITPRAGTSGLKTDGFLLVSLILCITLWLCSGL